MRRWLIVGAGGMLGRDLTDLVAADPNHDVTAAVRHDLDITDARSVQSLVPGYDVVVNTAAWTDVDGCEKHEAAATAVNGAGVSNLAAACRDSGATLIHISTDYVFDGGAQLPYAESAATDPVNAYGRSKLAGEINVLKILPDCGYIVRTSWLYGKHGGNFVQAMLNLGSNRRAVSAVTDQVGQPTWTHALAHQIVDLAAAASRGQAPAGIYHGTAQGWTSRYKLARKAFQLAGLDPGRVQPVTSDRFPRRARRPSFSVLGHERWTTTGVATQAHWVAQLKEAFAAGVFDSVAIRSVRADAVNGAD